MHLFNAIVLFSVFVLDITLLIELMWWRTTGKDIRRNRWSDRDFNWGPFTFAHNSKSENTALVIDSGEPENPGCKIRVTIFTFTIICLIPPIIRPWKRKVVALHWNDDTIARMGQNWYWDVHEREYGFSYRDGFMQVFLGRQTFDSSTTQSWSWFLPWTEWRHVRTSFYGVNGEHVWTETEVCWRLLDKDEHMNMHRFIDQRRDACPTVTFSFLDFDGEQLTATTRIEEREWKFGTGWFKWLCLFRKPRIRRSLDIQFSGETGKRKGSWKGGTMGTGIEMVPQELHESAFQRYCFLHGMTFIGADQNSNAVK